MNKRHTALLGIVLAFAVLMIWWIGRLRQTSPMQSQEPASVGSQQEVERPSKPAQAQPKDSTQLAGLPTTVPASNSNGSPSVMQELLERDYQTPISFYGKVVDENEMPVGLASVGFQWGDSLGEAHQASATSDGLGLFSLTGIRAKGLNVNVSRDGYYSSKRLNQTSFLYSDFSGRATFTPDPANPVIFHLRKKGEGTELVTSQYGVSNSLEARIPRDGTPVWIDILNRKVGTLGNLEISQKKPPYETWKRATSWSFHMSIPDGGFVEQDVEFPFEAPETGYQPIVQLDFQAGQTNWTTNLRKDYFVKFGQPPRYGRLHLETDIMSGSARLTYSVNPNGSRNLEPSSRPPPKQTVYE